MKPLTAILIGGGMLASAPGAMASFIGDEITATFQVVGTTITTQTLTDTFIADVPDSMGTGGSFGGMSLTDPLLGGYNGAMQQASGGDTFAQFFNFAISNAPEALDVMLTVSDIDWLDEPGTITAVTDVSGNGDITTGPDWVKISASVAEG
ncbi:MAG: hypothetical protein WBM84_11565, partial [Sedimenticolaceae bacterium]